ncbi:hypothetical protein J5N97_021536 [Dioscorea zingiberensis]|uniref:Uncharacterized protein n=1 Tax=Dioscorea zingiberensis TaxID=325984 RepID=A0A9D5HES5_9LILI|nr:hypothetical protein J5N97_021536 [Dioscorea zingiberensis]
MEAIIHSGAMVDSVPSWLRLAQEKQQHCKLMGIEIGVRGGEATSSIPFEVTNNFVADIVVVLGPPEGMEKLRGIATGGAGNGVAVCDAAGAILLIA